MDLISDTLTRLRNASDTGNKETSVMKSKMVSEILRILKREGFIADYRDEEKEYVVTLRYSGKEPVLNELKRVSSPGKRVYMSSIELKPVLKGRGIGIVSTSAGVMTIDEAKAKKVGGEYICYVW